MATIGRVRLTGALLLSVRRNLWPVAARLGDGIVVNSADNKIPGGDDHG